MTRRYVTAAQAQAYYADRAADYARRGFPKIASDYRWMADNAGDIARKVGTEQENTR